MGVRISMAIGDKVVKLDDDVVALIALDLNQSGLLEVSRFSKWRANMLAASLYDNHWLLAYEAHEQGWLPSRSGSDYIGADSFFSILSKHSVRFYSAEFASTASYFTY